VLRAINLGADIRPLRTIASSLAVTQADLDDSWTVLPMTAVEQLLTYIRHIVSLLYVRVRVFIVNMLGTFVN
jgi:hypothetical protein